MMYLAWVRDLLYLGRTHELVRYLVFTYIYYMLVKIYKSSDFFSAF